MNIDTTHNEHTISLDEICNNPNVITNNSSLLTIIPEYNDKYILCTTGTTINIANDIFLIGSIIILEQNGSDQIIIEETDGITITGYLKSQYQYSVLALIKKVIIYGIV